MKLTIACIVVGCLSIVALAQTKSIFDTGAGPQTRPVASAQTRPTTQQTAADVKSHVAGQLEQLEEEVRGKKIAILQDAMARLEIIASAAMDKHDLERAQAAAEYQRTLKATIAELSTGRPGAAKRPPRIPADAKQFQGHWYKAFMGQVSWDEAEKRCEDMGGHLAIIPTKAHDDFIFAMLAQPTTPSIPWIGGIRDDTGKWKWLDGSDMTYTNWPPNWPDGNNATGDPKRERNRIFVYTPRFAGEGNVASNKWAPATSGPQAMNGYVCEWDSGQPSGPARSGPRPPRPPQ